MSTMESASGFVVPSVAAQPSTATMPSAPAWAQAVEGPQPAMAADGDDVLTASMAAAGKTQDLATDPGHATRKTVVARLDIKEDTKETPFAAVRRVLPPNVPGYQLLRKLGEGAVAEVYQARFLADNSMRAIKFLLPRLARDETIAKRFDREAAFACTLDHPNLVRGIESGVDRVAQRRYLVMEYVDGLSAQGLIQRCGPLSVGDAARIVMDVALALEYAHTRNLIHRDIKPENILVSRSGLVKLADMGLAKELTDSLNLTKANHGFGTPHYMPYEQAVSAKTADARSDIHALGATFYFLLTGRVPFDGQNAFEILEKKLTGDFTPVTRLRPELPRVLDGLIAKMMAPEPRQRFQMVSELIVTLERLGLASPVLSFVNEDQAFAEPEIRRRLAGAGSSTELDLQMATPAPTCSDIPTWQVRYFDRNGQVHHALATTRQIQRALEKGRLAADSEGRRLSGETYAPLKTYPEFQSGAD